MTEIDPNNVSAQSVSFKCPRCNNLCGFEIRHAGKWARCTNCQERFIIPAKSDQIPETFKPEAEEPETGFCTSVFMKSWGTFFNLKSIEGLVFVISAVCFEFFTRHSDFSMSLPGFRLQLPIGLIIMFIARGCLCWYYAQVIGWTAMETESLPDIEIGAGFEFIWNIIKSNYLFLVAIVLSLIPFVLVGIIIGSIAGDLPTAVNLILVGCGLFISPMVLISMFVGKHIWQVFRFDYVVMPIIRAFRAYIVVASLFFLAVFLYWVVMFGSIGGYPELAKRGGVVVTFYLLANIGVTFLTIFAMRTIGLFCRHYRPYLPHTWAENDQWSQVS
jgi:DNA-directed RNA polymerase subunit RPC12/RpoP